MRSPPSGGTSTWIPSKNDVLDLPLVPVAGVGEHDARVGKTVPAEFASGGIDHRFEVAEVGRIDGDFGGDDDLVLVDRGLGVVALQRRLPVRANDA